MAIIVKSPSWEHYPRVATIQESVKWQLLSKALLGTTIQGWPLSRSQLSGNCCQKPFLGALSKGELEAFRPISTRGILSKHLYRYTLYQHIYTINILYIYTYKLSIYTLYLLYMYTCFHLSFLHIRMSYSFLRLLTECTCRQLVATNTSDDSARRKCWPQPSAISSATNTSNSLS